MAEKHRSVALPTGIADDMEPDSAQTVARPNPRNHAWNALIGRRDSSGMHRFVSATFHNSFRVVGRDDGRKRAKEKTK